jgi:hypothetical protein
VQIRAGLTGRNATTTGDDDESAAPAHRWTGAKQDGMEAKSSLYSTTGAHVMHFDITKPNVGDIDRLIRAIVGILLIIAVFRGSSWFGGILGAVLLATAYFRFCPTYTFFNFSSDSSNKDVAPVGK